MGFYEINNVFYLVMLHWMFLLILVASEVTEKQIILHKNENVQYFQN